jgi:hypothetical protein
MENCQMAARSIFVQLWWDDIFFVFNLSCVEREAFLTVLCAVYWSVWKLRNSIIFQNSSGISVNNIIILICSLMHYWSGVMKDDVVGKMKMWLLAFLDFIPLQVLLPLLPLVYWGSFYCFCACACYE